MMTLDSSEMRRPRRHVAESLLQVSSRAHRKLPASTLELWPLLGLLEVTARGLEALTNQHNQHGDSDGEAAEAGGAGGRRGPAVR